MKITSRWFVKCFAVFSIIAILSSLPGTYITTKQVFASTDETFLTSENNTESPDSPSATYKSYIAFVDTPQPDSSAWVMSGANPQRTSWVPEEVRGNLQLAWYRPIEPYIQGKVQIITSYNTLFISTARGLYALDSETGAEKWVFPTELPLGNSPTIYNGVAYVGGIDRNFYAIDAYSGQLLWYYTAGAGFDTNPVIVNGIAYLGNRDGYFYAINISGPQTGTLAWKYQTGGPIHYSAAYKDGILYFASDDSYAYALYSANGTLKWKSAKLPGEGFHSWWPVIYNNTVIFSGSSAYRTNLQPGNIAWVSELEVEAIFPNNLSLPYGTLIGPKTTDGWVDATKAVNYFQTYPWRRTEFILNQSNGQEITFDSNHDSKADYFPLLWFGTHGSNRYPAILGVDGNLYQSNAYASQPWGFRGQVSGWKYGTNLINTPAAYNLANDEPIAYSGGGRVIYWNLCCNRSSGAFDITIPNPGYIDQSREWVYFDYNLDQKAPGFDVMYRSDDIDAVYGGQNGVYGIHGDQNPPIPYKGKVYMHRGNSILAFSPTGRGTKLSTSVTRQAQPLPLEANLDLLKQNLEDEVTKILAAGHLLPGFGDSGNLNLPMRTTCGDFLMDYWHDPSEILYTLIRALPYLPTTMQTQVKSYLQSEYQNYAPYTYNHIGWAQGTPRDFFSLPPEIDAARPSFPATEWLNTDFAGWHFPPHIFYALWKYAQVFGGARAIFDASKSRLETAPSNDLLARMPHVHNSFISGYLGYLELQKLAGYTESSTVRSEYNRLLALRSSTFSKDSPYGVMDCSAGNMSAECYCKAFSVSRNFMYLTPELGQYLHDNAYNKVLTAVNEYNNVAPYWMVTRTEATYGEGVQAPIYDSWTMFQAKALILQVSTNDLVKYLDVPSVKIGDLYYIQNLIALIDTASP